MRWAAACRADFMAPVVSMFGADGAFEEGVGPHDFVSTRKRIRPLIFHYLFYNNNAQCEKTTRASAKVRVSGPEYLI